MGISPKSSVSHVRAFLGAQQRCEPTEANSALCEQLNVNFYILNAIEMPRFIRHCCVKLQTRSGSVYVGGGIAHAKNSMDIGTSI